MSMAGLENPVKDGTKIRKGMNDMLDYGQNPEEVELNCSLDIENHPNQRNVRSALVPKDSLESQFERHCRGIGSQTCTCFYPDSKNVTQFELSNDEITKNL